MLQATCVASVKIAPNQTGHHLWRCADGEACGAFKLAHLLTCLGGGCVCRPLFMGRHQLHGPAHLPDGKVAFTLVVQGLERLPGWREGGGNNRRQDRRGARGTEDHSSRCDDAHDASDSWTTDDGNAGAVSAHVDAPGHAPAWCALQSDDDAAERGLGLNCQERS